MKNANRKLYKLLSMTVIVFLFFVATAIQSSAIMSESEMKTRLSSYSSWFTEKEKDAFTVTCPSKNVSDDTAFSHVNKITSLLRGDLEDDYCEIIIKFRYSENNYSSFDAFTNSAFVLEDKLKSFWTNWSETNQMDLVCNYTSSSSGTFYSTNIILKLNGSDPDDKISEYDAKLRELVKQAKSKCKTKMELVQYYCKWLDTNVKYSLFYQYTNSPYVALMYGKGVCGSYANALKDLCELSGIPAIVPVNQDELNHAWNEIYVNGKWYTVDLCYVVEPVDGKYNGFCFANPDRNKYPVDHFSFIEKHKAEYVATFEKSSLTQMSSCKFSSVEDVTYTGSAFKPTVTVKNGSTTLKKDIHYTVSYSSNVNIGQAKITIKGISSAGYTGTKTIYFNILPTNPKKVTATSRENSIKLSWSSVKGATGYRVYIYSYKTKSYSIVKDFTKNTSFTMKNLSDGTDYKFAVKSYTLIGDKVKWAKGYISYTASTKPLKLKVKATCATDSITLKWSSVRGADGYRIFRYNPSSGKWSKLATITKTSYTVKKLKTSTKYTLAVRPYAKVGSVVYWGSYDKLIYCTTLSAPSTLSLSSASKGKVNVKWSAVNGVDGYQIYYKYNKSDSYKKLTNANTTSFTAELKSKSTCYIKVRAYTKITGGYAYSSFSPIKKITVK